MANFTLKHLARDHLYQTEKPYSTEFEVEGGLRSTNYILADHDVTIQEITGAKNFKLDVSGFCVIRATTDLDVEQALSQPDAVEEKYTSQLVNILKHHYPEYTRIEPFEFVVRKRHECFPSDQVVKITHQQPATLAHSDYSVNGAIMQIEAAFPGQAAYFTGREFDMINVWRPLDGANDDWPLAVCDYSSIDCANDIVLADLLYSDRAGENQLLHYSTAHQWYYIPHQRPEDLIVLRNVDSTGSRASTLT